MIRWTAARSAPCMSKSDAVAWRRSVEILLQAQNLALRPLHRDVVLVVVGLGQPEASACQIRGKINGSFESVNKKLSSIHSVTSGMVLATVSLLVALIADTTPAVGVSTGIPYCPGWRRPQQGPGRSPRSRRCRGCASRRRQRFRSSSLHCIGIGPPGRLRSGARRHNRFAVSHLCLFGSPRGDAGAPRKRGARHDGSRLRARVWRPDSKRRGDPP